VVRDLNREREDHRMDAYAGYDELRRSEREGTDYRIRFRHREGSIAIVAPHGGAIEPGTSEIALGIAGEDYSFYLFEGIKPSGNGRLHITSIRFDEPRCIDLIKRASRVITIHGEESEEAVVFLSGLDTALRDAIRAALAERGYTTRVPVDPGIAGRDRRNVCNRGAGGAGVQVELSVGLRRGLFTGLNARGRTMPTPDYERLISAMRAGLPADPV
jgi:phage replication-related protein YjqB (UPF0714/DUF867 family)